MYLRVVQTTISADQRQGFETFYKDEIIPALEKMSGCFSATLIRNETQTDEYLSITLWQNQQDALAYEKSGLFEKLQNEAQPFLSDPSQWKIQLSDDFTLEYKPVETKPVVESYPVVEESQKKIQARDISDLMYMRIVTIRVKPGKADEFKKFYRQIILPALEELDGCRFAYLSEGKGEENELFSFTIWDRKLDADNYEKSGLFDELTEQIKHTLSDLFQWKMSVEKKQVKKIVSSEDLKVSYFNVVGGRKFK